MKCQIITGNIERDVQRRLGSIKQKYFDEKMGSKLGYDFCAKL